MCSFLHNPLSIFILVFPKHFSSYISWTEKVLGHHFNGVLTKIQRNRRDSVLMKILINFLIETCVLICFPTTRHEQLNLQTLSFRYTFWSGVTEVFQSQCTWKVSKLDIFSTISQGIKLTMYGTTAFASEKCFWDGFSVIWYSETVNDKVDKRITEMKQLNYHQDHIRDFLRTWRAQMEHTDQYFKWQPRQNKCSRYQEQCLRQPSLTPHRSDSILYSTSLLPPYDAVSGASYQQRSW